MKNRGKGNLIVAQAGGPSSVINSSLAGVVERAVSCDQIGHVYGAAHGLDGLLREEFVDLNTRDTQFFKLLKRTPSAILGTCKTRLHADIGGKLLEIFKSHNIRYFLYIGGNDSAATCQEIYTLASEAKYELFVIAVPKTIDNDLYGTDHCPGYGSAARFVASATRDIGLDARALSTVVQVRIIETMGRNAGWLAAAAGLAKKSDNDAPHLIYFPERPFDLSTFIEDVRSILNAFSYAVVVVSEGIKDKIGRYICAYTHHVDLDDFGHVQLGGVAKILADRLSTDLNVKVDFDILGSMQRSFSLCISEVDCAEAYMVGSKAVDYAKLGISGCMVSLNRHPGKRYQCNVGLVPLDIVANKERMLPDTFVSLRENFISPEFVEYVMPLIGGSLLEYAQPLLVP